MYCTNCRTKFEGNYCPRCGAPKYVLRDEPHERRTLSIRERWSAMTKRRKLIAIAALVVVVLGIAAAIIVPWQIKIAEKKELIRTHMVYIQSDIQIGGDKYHLYTDCSGMTHPVLRTESNARTGNLQKRRCKKCYGNLIRYYMDPVRMLTPDGWIVYYPEE